MRLEQMLEHGTSEWFRTEYDRERFLLTVTVTPQVWQEMVSDLVAPHWIINAIESGYPCEEFAFPDMAPVLPFEPAVVPPSPWGFGGEIKTYADNDANIRMETAIPDHQTMSQFKLNVPANFAVIFQLLQGITTETVSEKQQLLVPLLGITEQFGPKAISAHISPALSDWLASYSDKEAEDLPEVREAMIGAWCRIQGADEADVRSAGSGISGIAAQAQKDHWLMLAVPGSSTSLCPENRYEPSGQSYKMTSHNVDGFAQQITLLIGLVAVCQLARRDK